MLLPAVYLLLAAQHFASDHEKISQKLERKSKEIFRLFRPINQAAQSAQLYYIRLIFSSIPETRLRLIFEESTTTAPTRGASLSPIFSSRPSA